MINHLLGNQVALLQGLIEAKEEGSELQYQVLRLIELLPYDQHTDYEAVWQALNSSGAALYGLEYIAAAERAIEVADQMNADLGSPFVRALITGAVVAALGFVPTNQPNNE